MSFGGADKQYFSDQPEHSRLGHGGRPSASSWRAPTSRWSRWSATAASASPARSRCGAMARYQAPIMNIVLNNRSYNNERNRIWSGGGRQFKTGRDMTCYNGSPDVDYVKAARAFGVEGETVKEPDELKPAILRARSSVVADGRPYLLEIHTLRDGIGAASHLAPGLFDRRPPHQEGLMRLQRSRRSQPHSSFDRRRRRRSRTGRAAARRRPRPRGDGVHAMPRPEHHHVDARRRRRLEAPRPQHGDARRPATRRPRPTP